MVVDLSAVRPIIGELRALPQRRDSDAERLESAGRLLLAAINAGAWSEPRYAAALVMIRQRAADEKTCGPISAWVEAVWHLRGKPKAKPDPAATFADDVTHLTRNLAAWVGRQERTRRRTREDESRKLACKTKFSATLTEALNHATPDINAGVRAAKLSEQVAELPGEIGSVLSAASEAAIARLESQQEAIFDHARTKERQLRYWLGKRGVPGKGERSDMERLRDYLCAEAGMRDSESGSLTLGEALPVLVKGREGGQGGSTAGLSGGGGGESNDHAPDFNWVMWRGKRYTFTKGNQAAIMGALYEDWKRGGIGLTNETIAEKIGAGDGFRVDTTFRVKGGRAGYHKAWRTMIRRRDKGIYYLCAD